ncbi:MAG TPA: hypothetical protein VN643_06640 [Pyrinomonadaceae bacterium]|nr:hypothetical protein [Pyrinomonadaceae bacterium]
MDDYSPIMIGGVVLVAFIAGYSIISYIIRRLKSDIAKGRGDDKSRPIDSTDTEEHRR